MGKESLVEKIKERLFDVWMRENLGNVTFSPSERLRIVEEVIIEHLIECEYEDEEVIFLEMKKILKEIWNEISDYIFL